MRVRWEYAQLPAPAWGDMPVAVIGGGTSLKGFDLSPLSSVHSIAVKGMIFDAPFASLGFGLDAIDLRRWWSKLGSAKMPVWWAIGDNWTDPIKTFVPGPLRLIKRRSSTIFSDDPSVISSGGTSGFGALNVAYLMGARQVILFGYDYRSMNGVWHANEQHYKSGHFYDPKKWVEWAACFDDTVEGLNRKGVEVLNASPDSAIAAFPKVSVEEGLRRCLM